jgi:small GTP-binding protein
MLRTQRCKCVLVGDCGVGKTALKTRIVHDTFDGTDNASTLGVDFGTKTFRKDNELCHMRLWDTSGSEHYRAVTSGYYRGANMIWFVYDVTRRSSFNNCRRWVQHVRNVMSQEEDVTYLLVANKIDQKDHNVTSAEGREWAESEGMKFVQVSPRTREGFSELLEFVWLDVPSDDVELTPPTVTLTRSVCC